MWIQLSTEDLQALNRLVEKGQSEWDMTREAKLIEARLEHYRSPEVNNQAYRDAAETKDGVLEVDDDAVVSISEDGGAYVMAWVWVGNEEI